MKHALLAIIYLTLSVLSHADSWSPPTSRIFSSPNGKFLLYVSPKALKSFPELPEDAAKNAEERKELGLNEACYATLFCKDDENLVGSSAIGFRPVWQQKLVNEVAPMDAHISDDGRFVVTTNDYGFFGDGDNVVVIYDSEGKLIRRYPLTAFIPKSAIDDYEIPQSTSSIYWSGQHRIDTKSGLLLLQVWQSGNPLNRDNKEPVTYRTVAIRLSDGEVLKEPESK